ncbi:hypothetical protein [Isoptericola sp. NPDC019482]|uniref:hypothetical protein n=1 Tax=Isoptericola sp. NPDC019482 TaxID=3154688 RepID=UPI003496A58F
MLALLAGASLAPLAPASAEPCDVNGGAGNDGTVGAGGECPGGPGDDGSGGGGGGGGGGSRKCFWGEDREVPCVTDAGVYNGSCYLKLMDPQPAKEGDMYSGTWGDHEDGYIVMCTPPRDECIEDMDGATEYLHYCAPAPMWQADPPPTDIGPSPAELADRAYARMQLRMGDIGSTPPSTEVDGDAIGLVGMPIWLWVADPAPNTTGPISESETDGGLTVTVDARLDRIVWTLTDDDGGVYATTTCAGSRAPFTEWSGHGDARPSPTCGFDAAENRRSGNITVTATAYWTAEWAGGGQNGTIPVPGQTETTSLAIGEAQVLVQ